MPLTKEEFERLAAQNREAELASVNQFFDVVEGASPRSTLGAAVDRNYAPFNDVTAPYEVEPIRVTTTRESPWLTWLLAAGIFVVALRFSDPRRF